MAENLLRKLNAGSAAIQIQNAMVEGPESQAGLSSDLELQPVVGQPNERGQFFFDLGVETQQMADVR